MAIDPSDVAQVAPALLAYLRDRLGHPLEYAEAPEQVTHGFSTHIYFFRVAGPALDQAWAGPLVLRCFPFADQGAFAEREGALQRFASDQGYPAPRPLAVETANDALGRPFIVMERLPRRYGARQDRPEPGRRHAPHSPDGRPPRRRPSPAGRRLPGSV